MHKLLLSVIALALFSSGATASACLNDSITDLSEGYLTRMYQELQVKRTATSRTDLVLSGIGALLLVGGTVRMLLPVSPRRPKRKRGQRSPHSTTRGRGESSATRSANQRESASRNSRPA
ncbi:MAG: hypothetical protein ACO1QR_16235 [Chthoniobacteraceae bacterium]